MANAGCKCPPIQTLDVLLFVGGEWVAATITGYVVGTNKDQSCGALYDSVNKKLYSYGFWKLPEWGPHWGSRHNSIRQTDRVRKKVGRTNRSPDKRVASKNKNPRFDVEKVLTKRMKSTEYKLAQSMVKEGYSELIEHRGYWYVQRI